MAVTLELYTRWKRATGHESDRQALIALGVSHGAAVHWKAGREATVDVIERMAKDLGEPIAPLVAAAMAGQTRGEAARTWRRLARQLGAVASLAAVAVIIHNAGAAHHFDALTPFLAIGSEMHYAKFAVYATVAFSAALWAAARNRSVRTTPTAVLE